jgi:hypothetical protein
VACAALVLVAGGRGGTPDLAARAYAATTGEGVIHWRIEQHNFSNGNDIEHLRIEGWARNGVTHITRSRVRRGKTSLVSDNRTAEGRSRTYLASADDYISSPAPTHTSTANPLVDGDPFAIFRRAYRAGKLTKIGPQRYRADLPGNDANGPSPIYDLDAKTALPRRFTLSDTVMSGAKRYDNRLVMRFTVYERLPFTPRARAKLRLQPHPGAGPKDDPAADHFAVLRGDRRPGPGAMRAIRGFARDSSQAELDAGGARALSRGHYLIPGHGSVCLGVLKKAGFGAACTTTAQAVKHGIAIGDPKTGKIIGVPDGVKALRARESGGGSETVAVRGNVARLPFRAYQWRFVR